MLWFLSIVAEVMELIVDKFIREVVSSLRERRVRLSVTPAARARLAEKGFSPAFGARPLRRVIRTAIEDELSEALLFGELRKGGTVTLDVAPANTSDSVKLDDAKEKEVDPSSAVALGLHLFTISAPMAYYLPIYELPRSRTFGPKKRRGGPLNRLRRPIS